MVLKLGRGVELVSTTCCQRLRTKLHLEVDFLKTKSANRGISKCLISRSRPHLERKKWGVDTNFVNEKRVDSCCVSFFLKDYQKELLETYKQKSYTTLKKYWPPYPSDLYAILGEGSFNDKFSWYICSGSILCRAFSDRRYQWWSLFAISPLDRWITLPTEHHRHKTFGPSLEKLTIRSRYHCRCLHIRCFSMESASSINCKHTLRWSLAVIIIISNSQSNWWKSCDMIAIYNRHKTFSPSLEKLAIRWSNR